MSSKKSTTIVVGMSGGVDSSVTALLLQQQGFDVVGVFMKNWEADDEDEYCSAAQDLADAQAVCAKLQIPLHTVNFSQAYWDRVFQYFLHESQAGRTPNPDVLCNKEIKFKAFLDYAQAHGASKIATGHYAHILERDGQYQLIKGLDRAKDQSYFLHQLNQHQLAHAMFPLAKLTKAQVRDIAAEHRLINHAKKDSTGICFIGERKFKQFLSEYLLAQPGPIMDTQQRVIGRHDGLMYYTIGQRQGLNIGGLKHASDAPWYVLQKDIDNNTLIVGQGANHPMLYTQGLIGKEFHWIAGQPPALPLVCNAKTRYRQPDQACQVAPMADGRYVIQFAEPQRAVTPGQFVVLYQASQCLGGGVIETTV
jgi:tRNA-specific 2-thiouridylase